MIPLNRVDSMEMLKPGPETPGRNVTRMQTLYRVNSIIDGTEMEVGNLGGAPCAVVLWCTVYSVAWSTSVGLLSFWVG